MCRLLVFALIACCLFGTVPLNASGQSSSPQLRQSLTDRQQPLPDKIAWLHDVEQAKAIAEKENKFVLVHFWGAQCRPCLKLEAFVFNNPHVISAISETVVPVKVQDEKQPQDFVRFGIQKMPMDVVISPTGKIVAKRSSPTDSEGYLRLLNQLSRLNQAKADIAKNQTGQNRYGAGQQMTEDQINYIRERDLVLQQQHVSNQLKSFQPRPDGIVYNRNPIKPEYHPDSVNRGQFQAAVPEVDRPGHLMPQVDSSQVSLIENPTTKNKPPSRPELKPTPRRTVDNPHYQPPAITERQLAPPQRMSLKDSQAHDGKPETRHIRNEFINSSRWSNRKKTRSFVPVMEGFCPVTLMTEKKWVRGNKDWGCLHRGRLFLFTNQENRDRFMDAPEKYCPALLGMDPVVFARQGRLVDGGAMTGIIAALDGQMRMVLFSSEETKAEFVKSDANRQRYLKVIEAAEKSAQQRTAEQSADSNRIR